MNPSQAARPSLFSFGGGSMTKRIVILLAGVLLLVIGVSVVKGALGGSNQVVPDLVSLVQDQEAMLHITGNAAQNVSETNLQNFNATAQMSLQSEQSQLILYLQQSGRKLSNKEVLLKISSRYDTQLTNALSSSTYDPTYKSIMQQELQVYQRDIKQAFYQEKGPVGRSMLNSDYQAAGLLLKQLGS